jgi:uncharacterized protein (DUF934 family)
MALIKNGALVDDPFVYVAETDQLPPEGPVIVHLEQWQAARDALLARGAPVGVKLKSDQPPDLIAEDLGALEVVALEFPAFRDGRAYSYARLLRDRYGFQGQIRAVGDVLMEQLHFMLRTGFDAFELDSDDPLADYRTALEEFSVWYQPAADGRETAVQLRHSQKG